MKREQRCYLCGSRMGLTRDHVPPQNLFKPPLPSDLITVPCCSTCNGGYSKLEEEFRAFVASPINCSRAGKWILEKKVIGSTFKRSPRFTHYFAQHMQPGNVVTPAGEIGVPVKMNREFITKCLIKITKGLLAHFYPNINSSDSNMEFDVDLFEQFRVDQNFINSFEAPFTYDQRGDGQFKFWRGLADDVPEAGVWIYGFYDAVFFVVQHDARRFH